MVVSLASFENKYNSHPGGAEVSRPRDSGPAEHK
jgi:hypothetical protein